MKVITWLGKRALEKLPPIILRGWGQRRLVHVMTWTREITKRRIHVLKETLPVFAYVAELRGSKVERCPAEVFGKTHFCGVRLIYKSPQYVGGAVNPRPSSAELMSSFSVQHVDIASLLIKFHTDVNATDRWLFTPLHEAAQKGRTQLCALLVSQTRDAHVTPKVDTWRTRDTTQETVT